MKCKLNIIYFNKFILLQKQYKFFNQKLKMVDKTFKNELFILMDKYDDYSLLDEIMIILQLILHAN